MSKATLRTFYRAKRKKISKRYKENAAIQAANLLSLENIFQQSHQIACYLPHRNEFETWAIIKLIWLSNKQCYLPVVSDEKSMHFLSYEEGDTLKANRYAILEPVKSRGIALNKLEIIILPLLAFDKQGNRLGTGGGYYDRTLATMSQQVKKPLDTAHSRGTAPFLIGLGFSRQEHKALPNDPWDIKLNAVLTEKAFTIID